MAMKKIKERKKDNKKKKVKYLYIDNNSIINKINSFGFLDSEHVKEYMKDVVSWYKIKFPDKDLTLDDGKVSVKDTDIKNISEKMSINQFNNRISHTTIESLECNYIGDNIYKSKKYNNNTFISIRLLSKDKKFFKRNESDDCLIIADKKGNIFDLSGDNLLISELKKEVTNLNLEQLLYILKKSDNNTLDYYSLEYCIDKRNNDLIVREEIIKTISKELVFSAKKRNNGYFRALNFLKDFSNYYNLKIDNNYLDNIVSEEYIYANNKSANNNVKTKKLDNKKNLAID